MFALTPKNAYASRPVAALQSKNGMQTHEMCCLKTHSVLLHAKLNTVQTDASSIHAHCWLYVDDSNQLEEDQLEEVTN